MTEATGTSLPPTSSVGLEEAVDRALSTTFEDMAFMEVSTLADAAPAAAAPVWSRLETRAPLRADLLLQMNSDLVDNCIDALYAGIDANDAVRQDVVREFLNTIAGLVMSNMTETQSIDLGLPQSGIGGTASLPVDGELEQCHVADRGGLVLTVRWT